MVLMAAAPILVFLICVCLCVRRRDFLGGPGSLACCLLMLTIAGYASRHWSLPIQYLVYGLLSTGYVWLYFIRPFRAGLKGDK